MKINIEQVKEKIAGFIFDLIIESGSKSKFFRKYTNHRFRKQYERVVDSCNYYFISRRNYDLEKRIADCMRRSTTYIADFVLFMKR